MGLYDRYVLPRGINLACSSKPNMKQREKIIHRAEGDVLEIGMGSGLNLPYYDRDKVRKVWGLEPSEGMRRSAADNIAVSDIEVEHDDEIVRVRPGPVMHEIGADETGAAGDE